MGMVRLAKFEDYSIISDFLHQHWSANHIYTRSKALFDWTFRPRDSTDSDHYSFALALDGSDCIGILGAIPFTLNVYGESRLAYWLANWMTVTDKRTTTAGLQLLKFFDRTAHQVLISFGINQNVARIYQALRWNLLTSTPRYLAFVPSCQDRILFLLSALYPTHSTYSLKEMVNFFHFPIEQVNAFSKNDLQADLSDWDQYGWKHFSTQSICASRHSDYLQWRYLRHPIFTYHLSIFPSDDQLGLLVYRVEPFSFQDQDGSQRNEVLLRVVELLPVSQTNLQQMLFFLYQQLITHNAIGFDLWGFYGPCDLWLKSLGFHTTDEHPFGMLFPSRFQPLEPNATTIMSAFKGIALIPKPNSDWYWTKSDSDQDRPN